MEKKNRRVTLCERKKLISFVLQRRLVRKSISKVECTDHTKKLIRGSCVDYSYYYLHHPAPANVIEVPTFVMYTISLYLYIIIYTLVLMCCITDVFHVFTDMNKFANSCLLFILNYYV